MRAWRPLRSATLRPAFTTSSLTIVDLDDGKVHLTLRGVEGTATITVQQSALRTALDSLTP